MGPRYPCKEYGDFRAARDRRKHLNMLLMDYCVEYDKTYFPDGSPRSRASKASLTQLEDPEIAAEKLVKAGKTINTAPAKVVWAAVYKEGGLEAAQSCAKVNNRRTPSGNFFALVNPGLARDDPDTIIPNKKLPNLQQLRHIHACALDPTEAAMEFSGRAHPAPASDAIDFELPKSTSVGQHGHTGYIGDAVSSATDRQNRTWLMAHQKGDRVEGQAVAKHINSSRTPSGGFATFDLAKAPK